MHSRVPAFALLRRFVVLLYKSEHKAEDPTMLVLVGDEMNPSTH